MKIILLKTENKIGKKGEIKNVPDGYAQNFLIPRKIAAPADSNTINTIKRDIKKTEKKTGKKHDPSTLANKLRGVTITFTERADENGTYFASITRDKIAKKLQALGIAVKSKKIKLKTPIKSAGEYKVTIEIDPGYKSEISVIAKNL
jgi:large subunit ribosomal protein L9